jgi:lycopene cyclase domain-containing protein
MGAGGGHRVLTLGLVAQQGGLLLAAGRAPLTVDERPQALVDDAGGEDIGQGEGQGRLAGALAADQPDPSRGTGGGLSRVGHLAFAPLAFAGQNEDVGQYSYVAILAFVMAGCLWLEVALRTRVFRRWRRLVLSILPAVVIFFVWDVYAVAEGHWWFDTERILGVYLPGSVPFDEVLFFIAIPIASVLTLEAVRSVKPHWMVGDEAQSVSDVPDDPRDAS